MRERAMAGAGKRRLTAGVVGLALAMLIGPLASPASAAPSFFCPPGSGAGQCSEQAGVATDFQTERLYVADKGNNRIDVFEANGTFLFAFGWKVNASAPAEELQTCTVLTRCQKGSSGTGDGQFKTPRRVAVDNDPASASRHDVYVFDSGNFRVQKFDSSGGFLKKTGKEGKGPGEFNDEVDLIAVSPTGKVYVSDMPQPAKEPRIEVFDPELGFLEEFELAHQDRLNSGLAVDGAGDVYAAFNDPSRIFKFHSGGAEFGAPYPLEPGTETTALALGAEGQLFAAQSEGRVGKGPFQAEQGTFSVITDYSPAGAYLERFGYGLGFGTAIANFAGLALLHSDGGLRSGDAFASLKSGANRIAYAPMPPPGPVVAPLSLEAEAGNTKATLAGELNPEGSKPTKYRFEYVDQHSFETEGGFASPNTKKTAEVEVPIKSGPGEEKDLFSLHAAEALVGCPDPAKEIGEGKCLTPETEYRFRLVGKNPEGEGEAAEGSFTTKAPLEITETWASEAGTEGARLSAKVNALGIPTSGFFEYVDRESFEAEGGFASPKTRRIPDPAHALDFGSGKASVQSALLGGLLPGRAYLYRLVATDELLEEAKDPPLDGPVRTLRPFAKPAQAPCPNEEFRSGAGALLPDCRAYEMVSPLDKNNADIVPLGEFTTFVPAALDQSAILGGKVSYTTSTAFGDTESAPYSAEYIAQRDEAAKEWRTHAINPPRGKPVVQKTQPQINTEFKLFSADLCEAWQRTVAEPPLTADAVEGFMNLYRRSDQSCGGAPGYEALSTVKPPNASALPYEGLELQGASADGSVAIYAAPDNLAAGAPPQPAECTSKGKGCELRLYEKRPGQEPQFVCFLPGGEAVEAPCEAGSGGGGEGKNLYGNMQGAISADGERIYWSGAGKVYLRVGGTQTQAVSAAGEALSGTSSSTFLGASADGSVAAFVTGKEADLYRYDAEDEETTPLAHKVVGFAGMSEDGSRIYFASEEALSEEPNSAGGKAQAGRPNLYLSEEGKGVQFVATLGSGDPGSVTFSAVALTVPIYRMSRLNPDGSALAFISTASPTGYDNTDVSSPEECGEGHSKAVCDAEVFLYEAEAREGKGRLVCASCNPSGERPAGVDIAKPINKPAFFAAAEIPAWENNEYASRVLSANGHRLFFEASDALSPLDTNGATDVYEWEQAGEGSCEEGSPSFDPASGGCVDLISSGKSARDSTFLDADAEGKDAFFTTLSSLVPQDYGLIDVYDARARGGFPPPPPRKLECEGEACQSPPGPPGEVTPASSTFGGEEAPEEAKGKKKKGHKRKGRGKKARPRSHRRRAAR